MKARVLSLVLAMSFLCTGAFVLAGQKKDKDKQPAPVTWYTNLQAALKEARDAKKVVMLDFTGSDWCHWCQKLKEETLTSPEFDALARESFVPVEVDFPQGKQQSKEEKKQNEELKNTYKPDGFPTIVFVETDGKEIGRIVGYKKKEDFLAAAKDILAKRAPAKGK